MDWLYENAEHERVVETLHVNVPEFERTGFSLWKPGALTQLDGKLVFDEWSYFIGFRADAIEAPCRAARLGLCRYFSGEFYDLLLKEGQMFAVHVDGWWEFSPATESWFERIKECAPSREIIPRGPGAIDWTPQFV